MANHKKKLLQKQRRSGGLRLPPCSIAVLLIMYALIFTGGVYLLAAQYSKVGRAATYATESALWDGSQLQRALLRLETLLRRAQLSDPTLPDGALTRQLDLTWIGVDRLSHGVGKIRLQSYPATVVSVAEIRHTLAHLDRLLQQPQGDTATFAAQALPRVSAAHLAINHVMQRLYQGQNDRITWLHDALADFRHAMLKYAAGLALLVALLIHMTWRYMQSVNALQESRDALEIRVQERTAELVNANAKLKEEMSERKRAEIRLRQTQKMEAIGILAGGIAHDFNNILAAILGYTELAQYDTPPQSVVWNHLQEVLTAGKRAKNLVQQILTFSRQTEQGREPTQLHLIVKEVLQLLRASFPSTIEIRQHIVEDAGVILADPTQMHQVVMNLCTNAEYAMRQTGGVLDVRLEPVDVTPALADAISGLTPGPHLQLTIRDTGHGIDARSLEHIFDPFFTTKGVGEGTGMGLAVVHGIVTGYGGAISVASIPGQETVFEVYLPCMRSPVKPESNPHQVSPGGNERILLVDDEIALARLGQEMLSRLNYQVTVCTSSLEALERFRAMPDQFDLVITDQTMPQMTGEALIGELRDIQPDIPIVLCTGFSHTMNDEKARALGIDAFLMKPLVIDDLSCTIRQILAQHPERHDWQPGVEAPLVSSA